MQGGKLVCPWYKRNKSEVIRTKGKNESIPITKEALRQMREVDIKSVERSELVDVHSVVLHRELPMKECIEDYIRQIKNPYCYLDHGTVVKISFAGKKSLEDCLKSIVFSKHDVF